MNAAEINYTKEAFLNPINLGFLIIAMLTAFFLSGQAPWHQVVLLFAAAVELLYLGIVPRNDRFRRLIRSQYAAAHAKPPSHQEIFRLLTKQSQKRYVRLRNLEKSIEANYRKLSYASQGLLNSHLQKISGLLESFLNLIHTRERYERFSQSTTEDEVIRAITRIRSEIENDTPKVRAIKQRRLSILEKRLEKYKKAHENLDVIEAQLETVEDVVKYIHEQSLTLRNPDEITFQLDTLLSEVEETQASVEEIEDVFSRSSDLLSDVDSYESEQPEVSEHRDRIRN